MPGTRQPAHLPSTLTSSQIESVLACVDRESPMGKRDYAVLLLAAKLGLRVSDIRSLRPRDIDWEKHELRITQGKTGEPLVLPLPADVGWAIIDYMKNARSVSDAPEIFLLAVAPYVSLQILFLNQSFVHFLFPARQDSIGHLFHLRSFLNLLHIFLVLQPLCRSGPTLLSHNKSEQFITSYKNALSMFHGNTSSHCSPIPRSAGKPGKPALSVLYGLLGICVCGAVYSITTSTSF